MVLVDVVDRGGVDAAGEYATAAEAVDEVRRLWMEDGGEGWPVYVVREAGGGAVVATVLRDQGDAEVCHTLWCDGTRESHRCEYVVGSGGYYERTVVTAVAG